MENRTTRIQDLIKDRQNILKSQKELLENFNKKSINEIAQEVIDGKWGNGTERKNKLEKAGYNYNDVQNKVNEILESKSYKTYTVKSGDTLSEIAEKNDTTVSKIVKDNNLENANLIYPGQKLKI